jgi:hypothetical protein
VSGGQFFFPDENRYQTSREIAASLIAGDLESAAKPLSRVSHLGFRVVGILPALIEEWLGESPRIPALFFCFFSIANIFLLWKIARAAGATETEALFAAYFLALSSTFFYYSRHLLPYDLAFSFGLLAIWAAVRTPARLWDSCVCGLLASCCFLIYFGYWTLAVFAILLHAFYRSATLVIRFRRLAVAGLCFVSPFLLVFGINYLLGGQMFQKLMLFSDNPGLAAQGLFSEGWRLPIAYFWYAEHGLFALWVLALGAALWGIASGRLSRSATIGVFGVLFFYGTLVALSVGLHKFVVLGRLARQCVPFFCLIAAHWIERIRMAPGVRPAWVFRTLIALAFVQAMFNFYTPMTQVFPADFKNLALQARNAHRANVQGGEYRVLRINSIYPEPRRISIPEHSIILQSPHPTEYLPLQYEGYTPSQREKLRSTDISMRLVYIPEPVRTRSKKARVQRDAPPRESP